MSNQSNQSWHQSEHIDTSDVGDRCVLYHQQSGKALVLNPVGSWMWKLLGTAHTTAQLAQKLREEYSHLNEAQATTDVEGYLEQLRAHEALQKEA